MKYPLYRLPAPEEAIDQGDLIEDCPTLRLATYDAADLRPQKIEAVSNRVLVLTQTCDLAQQKATRAVCALVFDAAALVSQQLLKAADIRGAVRAGRVFGWYFLPKSDEPPLPEMVVDLRQLHTIRLDLLTTLCQRGKRRARVQPLYREHRAKHFADTYSRIGLPEPYATD
jgi:hypothetical protein